MNDQATSVSSRSALIDALAAALAALRTPDEARALLADLCTPAEVHSLAERWHVARLLDAGELTYREIHDATGVSTTTIVRVARFLRQEDNRGYRALLDRTKGAEA
jgi:TrpR-related protein YerC/YecD